MAGVVAEKLDALELHGLVKVDCLDLAKAPLEVVLVKERVVHGEVTAAVGDRRGPSRAPE